MVSTAMIAGISSSLLFIALNVMMNLYMKWLFSGREVGEPWTSGGDFPLPWTMLAIQQLEAYLVLQPWIAYTNPDGCWGWCLGERPCEVLYQVCAVTVLFCLNVGLNSLSLVRISITLNQTVRAFLPVGVLLLATVLERRTYPAHSYCTTAVLVIGIALTCWGSPNFEMYGFCLALASTLVAAVGSSLSGRILTAGPFSNAGPSGIMRLMMVQSLPACFMFGMIAVITEGRALQELMDNPGAWQWYERFGLVSVSSVLALLSNIGRCGLVAATSALMETLAGNAKVAALCVIDHHLFGTRLENFNYCGIAITFSGFSVHVLLQYASHQSSSDNDKRSTVLSPGSGGAKDQRFKPSLTPHFEDSETDTREEVKATPSMRDRPVNRPRLISAADTGLLCEHVALEMGRQPSRSKRLRIPNDDLEEDHVPVLPRPRSMTWQAGTDAETWLGQMGMDFTTVFEEPRWLLAESFDSSDPYFSSTATAASMAMRGNTPGASSSQIANSARSRFYTDPLGDSGASGSLATLSRARNHASASLLTSLAEDSSSASETTDNLLPYAEDSPPMEETVPPPEENLVFAPL
mmetsp:Transcript_64769/g.189956  ORF Transcript_64769/g.189956 Transcript_64769/m.189956 type:complete len:579 (-) Transcript_64769:38-1774(-)